MHNENTNYLKIGCNCCSNQASDDIFGAGQRLIETNSIILNYDVYNEYSAKYPFVNQGCGPCGSPPKEEFCTELYKRRYSSYTITGETVQVWVGTYNEEGPDQVTVGGTESESANNPIESQTEPSYYSCECQQVTADPIQCIQVCESGDSHESRKIVNISYTPNITQNFCPPVQTPEGPMTGCILGEYEPECQDRDPNDPDDCYFGTMSNGGCSYCVGYLFEDGDPRLQGIDISYSGSFDAENTPWDNGSSKLNDITYPNKWDDTQDCIISNSLNSWWADWPKINYNPNDVIVSYSTSKTAIGLGDSQEILCGIEKSVDSQFQKIKMRWRFLVPSSCYIKIWVCRFSMRRLHIGQTGSVEWTLESSEVESHVLQVPPTESDEKKCFDGFKSCGDHQLSSILSPEFEIKTPDTVEFPSEDPTVINSSNTLTRYNGISIVGLSYVDGWEPPLFEFDEDVWKSKCPSPPYWMPTKVSFFPYDINTAESGIYWPNTPEQTQKAIDYFNENINVVAAP